jgi:hypothetical protein
MLSNTGKFLTELVNIQGADDFEPSSVHFYGDRIIVVFKKEGSPPDRSVTVIDTTGNPQVPDIPGDAREGSFTINNVEEAAKQLNTEEIDSKGRRVVNGKTLCRYCGKPCTARGCTRHELKCPENPERRDRIQ